MSLLEQTFLDTELLVLIPEKTIAGLSASRRMHSQKLRRDRTIVFAYSKQPASDSHLLGFFCSFIDLQDFGVPVEALNIILIDIAIAAMHLKSLVADPHGHLAGKVFCHGVQ